MSGNKGDWSEIYVFLKLLAEGRIHPADASLNAIPDVYYPLIKILRHEQDTYREYNFGSVIKVIDGSSNREILSLPIEEFVNRSKELLENIKQTKGRSLQFPEIEEFLRSIDVTALKASGENKADIRVVLHDLKTGMNPQLGFSIKSLISNESTLLNAGTATNFIFRLVGDGEIDIDAINSIDGSAKVLDRVSRIQQSGYSLEFERVESKTFQLNLQLIDSCLPHILAHILLLRFAERTSPDLTTLLEKLALKNPLGYNQSEGHPFYEYKIKKLLTESALGMVAKTVWKGVYDASGGIIFVKEDGEIVCYHIFNHFDFENYLLNNNRLETPSTTKHKFAHIYSENDKLFFKLNLQIRFK